jgi:hypothetical protein
MNILLWSLMSLCMASTNAVRILIQQKSRPYLYQSGSFGTVSVHSPGQLFAAASGTNSTLALKYAFLLEF